MQRLGNLRLAVMAQKKSPFNNLPAVIFIELDASDGVAPDKQNAMLGCV